MTAEAGTEIADWIEFVAKRMELQGIENVHVDDVSGTAGGFSAQIVRLTVTAKEASQSLILKRTRPGGLASSSALGIAREAEFFTHLAPLLDPECTFLPKVFYSAVEMDGYKVVIMEDLRVRHGVQSGYFFGNVSCINWGKDLPKLTERFPQVKERDIVHRAFELGALLHGRFWLDKTLLSKPYLRAGSWIIGEGEDTFDSTANFAINTWAKYKAAQAEKPTINMNPRIVELIDNCAAKVNFKDYVEMWKTLPWTLVHGDFHPANFMVVDSRRGAPFDLIALDWEAVGVGSGPQDLGQYLISHSAADSRRSEEQDAIDTYLETVNKTLKIHGGQPLTREYVLSEYVEGGLTRWAWLFPVCSTVCPAPAMQYFHDQMLAFLDDHVKDISAIGMMRP